MDQIEEFCPAKVNLFLAVTGKREDGFHDLVSVMAPLDLGDRLVLSRQRQDAISLTCSDPKLPVDEGNLVVRAAAVFRRQHPFEGGLRIHLEKRVPAGAGLGGGSSDAAGLLRGLNRLLGEPLQREELLGLAASLGSDCPFFLAGETAVARGRGERLEPLPEAACARLRGTRLFLVKPSFPVSTAWAYGALAKMPEAYCPVERAEERLAKWLAGDAQVRELLFNNLEGPVFRKYVPLPVLKSRLEALTAPVLMSGSGSTLFALLERDHEEARLESLREAAFDALGQAGWTQEARIL